MQTGGSPILSTRLKDGMTTDSTGQPVTSWFAIYLRQESQQAENSEFFIVNKSVTADGSLLSQTGGVNTIYPAPDIHEHFMVYNRLRNTAYIFMHNLNNPERTVTNCVNIKMHTDVITA